MTQRLASSLGLSKTAVFVPVKLPARISGAAFDPARASLMESRDFETGDTIITALFNPRAAIARDAQNAK